MNQQLLRTREKWYSAFIAGDVATMHEIETESFTVINDFGVQNKIEQLNNISKSVDGGRWFAPESRTEDLSLEILNLGNFAFIHGQGLTISKNNKTPEIFFSELWQNVDGQWRVINLHYTTARNSSVLRNVSAN
ncbi:nuclear transport factor 2 family protein [Ectopseudomonas alcaliphila]|uniref:Nuclear transport factor 2 family protein n=1 Tax=Ectopseudomonas alcaliphila TaxID=101564 RepID=A0ABU4PZY6_9GAMM|nr:nuclear transport factor 2 family protein [Pseudomonas alcaliphila]MDX5993492.1 nuclear transport factor 2 family protein [Pseudomonas alcaliphila]